MQIDSKLRRRIRQKKIAQGHAPDDHELANNLLNNGGFSCKSLNKNMQKKKTHP